MKRIVCIFLPLIAAIPANHLFAQITFGIKAGLVAATLSNSGSNERITFQAGYFLNKNLGKHWSFQTELLYSGAGRKLKLSTGNKTLSSGYIMLPALFQYFPLSKLYFEAGPQFGYLLSAKSRTDEEELNVRYNYRKVEALLNIGAGFNATKNLSIYGRYNYGLPDIVLDDRNLKNRIAVIGIAFTVK